MIKSTRGVYLQHVASFVTYHECAAFNKSHNMIATDHAEVLTCIKAEVQK